MRMGEGVMTAFTPSQLRMTLIASQGGSFLNTLMKHPEPLQVTTSQRIYVRA